MNLPPKNPCCRVSHLRDLQLVLALMTVITVSCSFYFSLMQSYEGVSDSLTPNDFFGFSQSRRKGSRQLNLATYGGVRYHVVFSTGCSEQQHWQSYVFFYHAYKVRQPGNITRIVSGCEPSDENDLRKFHESSIATMSDRFHIHFTPEYAKVATARPYKYYNKPCGLYHWMTNVLRMDRDPEVFDDDIIILADPDFILLRPILHDTTDQSVIFVEENPLTRVVKHGMPMAQQDGYLYNEWMGFNIPYITGGGNISHVSKDDGPLYYNAGPPYLATVGDMYRIVTLWKDYVPRVYEEYPATFAEMFGYVIATTQLNLRHTLVKSFVVSTADVDPREIYANREGWAMVDVLPDDQICIPPQVASLPNALHYCQRYLLGKWFFSKYRLKKKYLSCETALLTHPPLDSAARYNYWIRPPPDRGNYHAPSTRNITRKQARYNAFMLCGLISKVNEAARYFKIHHCNGTANMNETYNFHDDPYST